MKRLCALLLLATLPALADTIITREGASYSGQFAATKGEITFTDASGINYNFPRRDVQSLVFTASTDIVTLRSGKVYTGKFTGANPLSFTDNQGIQYQFPAKDVASLVLSENAPPAPPAEAKIIPAGSEIYIRTNETIDSDSAPPGTSDQRRPRHRGQRCRSRRISGAPADPQCFAWRRRIAGPDPRSRHGYHQGPGPSRVLVGIERKQQNWDGRE
jgi:hypothetical protein